MNQPHRRYNPLLDEWVLVSPQRTQRPWQGQVEAEPPPCVPSYDPDCYLCPGNRRASGESNPDYVGVYSFQNDFPALIEQVPSAPNETGLLRSQTVSGECRVLCYTPDHNRSMGELTDDEMKAVIHLWIDQTRELGDKYQWVQVFENRGAMMGASNPHPHGQVWAGDFLPTEVDKESWTQVTNPNLLLNYLNQELQAKDRIVLESENWVWLVPFWAVWPFETMLLPKRKVSGLLGLTQAEIEDLSSFMPRLVSTYDRLFNVPFPYSMGWHGVPRADQADEEWHVHAHFFPPLLRSATIRKFMVGYEMLAESQRDLTPEQAAERLRSVLA